MTAARRPAALVAAIALLAIAGLTALAPRPAGALEGNPMVVPARSTVEVEQPPIPGQDPASATGSSFVAPPDPSTCPALPQCMNVKIDIEIPVMDAADDFFVLFEMTWDAPSGLEDIDFWLYDDQQIQEEKGSTGYTEVGSSASADNPEKINVYGPTRGTYNLVAINFSGAHTAWKIKAVSTVGEFESPFESLAPAPGMGTRNPDNKVTTSTTRPPTTSTAPTSTTVSIPEGVVLPDNDFDAFGEQEDQLAALEDAREAAAQLQPRELEAPSALALLLYMVVAPAALASLIAVAIKVTKQRRRAQSVSTA